MDCRASLAVTNMRHGERSEEYVSWRAERRRCVMASVARPSILEALSDGLPRFARSDGVVSCCSCTP